MELKDSIETDIKIIGNKNTITQIVILMAYIRHIIKSNKPSDILLKIGKNRSGDFFAIQVNDYEIDDINPTKTLEIN